MTQSTQTARPEPGPGKPKIFGLGLSRTGTTSLTSALDCLGFPSVHYPTSLAQIEAHAGATDVSVLASFKALDQMFPGSRFIVTTRALEPWLKSCESLWKKNAAVFASFPFVMNLEQKVYGGDGYDRALYIAARAHHLSTIAAHFQNRPNDVLYVDIFETPDPWRPLCQFLNVPVPAIPYPNQNRSDAVDRLLLKFLDATGDCAKLAKITTISEGYLRQLQESRAAETSSTRYQPSTGFEQMRILESACTALGLDRVAGIVGLSPQQIKLIWEYKSVKIYSAFQYLLV
jgi:hypothetical protein